MAKESFSFKVTDEDKAKRLDKFLAEKFQDKFSRSFLQRLILEHAVLLNGIPAKNNHKILPGDAIEVSLPEPKGPDFEAEEIDLDIVYEDNHLLVINKPADMVVHPAPGNYSGTLVNALLWHCNKLSSVGGIMKPGIVHRLDKGTSGLLVAAKTDDAHRRLSRQFVNKTSMKRVYVALVHGIVQLDNGTVELPIGRSVRDRKKMAVKFENSKSAITHYKVLERFKGSTLLEVTLGTGRTHQIRVHMSYIGHPIIGDAQYGASSGVFGRPALHAKTIGFVHPATKKYVEFTSKLPDDMKALIERQRV